MPAGQMKLAGWRALTTEYTDRTLVEMILGICKFAVKIGYEGSQNTIQIHLSLSTTEDEPSIVAADIAAKLHKNYLQWYPTTPPCPIILLHHPWD